MCYLGVLLLGVEYHQKIFDLIKLQKNKIRGTAYWKNAPNEICSLNKLKKIRLYFIFLIKFFHYLSHYCSNFIKLKIIYIIYKFFKKYNLRSEGNIKEWDM